MPIFGALDGWVCVCVCGGGGGSPCCMLISRNGDVSVAFCPPCDISNFRNGH